MYSSADLCSARHCNICLLLEPAGSTHKLLKCSGCNLVYYCGVKHQRADWLHRAFCRAAGAIMQTYNVAHPYLLAGQPRTGAALERVTLQVKLLLAQRLSRKLEWHEEELTSFPAHCAVCYSFEKLQHCRQCGGVSYCSASHRTEHAQEHSRHCTALQLYYCPYKVQAAPTATTLDQLTQRVPQLQHTDLMGAIEHATAQRLPAQPHATLEAYQCFATAADYSCIATICYALTFIDVPPMPGDKKFTIFIVGATMEQLAYFQPQHVQFFFLQYPHIMQLQLCFIGPEVYEKAQHDFTCESNGVQRHVACSTHKSLLQDIGTTLQPSLLVAFNCGFAEYAPTGRQTQSQTLDTWRKGIEAMLAYKNIPLLFTSYTKLEAEYDLATLMRVAAATATDIQHIVNIELNPYRDLRPLRNWQLTYCANDGDADHLATKDEPIFYRNGYVQMVRTPQR